MRHRIRGLGNLGLGLLVGGALACGPAPKSTGSGVDFSSGGYEGFTDTHFDLLAATCAVDGSGNLTVAVAANETAYFYVRSTDGKVVLNANDGSGNECAVKTTAQIGVTGASDSKIILDYLNGKFGAATAGFKAAAGGKPQSGGPGTLINLTPGSKLGTVQIRGSQFADTFTLGTDPANSTSGAGSAPMVGPAKVTYVAYVAGTAPSKAGKAATYPDIAIAGVDQIMISAGLGDDVITGQGGAAVGGSSTLQWVLDGGISLTVYGGAGNDTITSGATSTGSAKNLLFGNDGDDLFLQQCATTKKVGSNVVADQSGLAKDIMDGGNGVDTVDYSCRTNPISVNLATGLPGRATTSVLTSKAAIDLFDGDQFTLTDAVPNASLIFDYVVDNEDVNQVTCTGVMACGDTLTVTDGSKKHMLIYQLDSANVGCTTAVGAVDVTGVDTSATVDLTATPTPTATDIAVATVAAIRAAVTGTLIAVAPTQVGAKIKVAAAGVAVTTSAVADFTIVAKTKYVGSTNLPIVATGMASVDEIASATLAAINAQSGIGVLELSGTISASSVITLTNFALAVGTAIVSADTAFATVVPTPGVAADIAGAATDGESSENDDVQATVENVIGGAGADTLDASQATLAQHVLMGMAGNDLLIGSDLADTLYGGPGDDKLHGGGDADLLIGGDGNDVLQGGLGNDTIDGDGTNCTKTALPSSGTFPQAAALSAVPFISAKCDSKFQPAAATAGSNTLDYSDHIVGVTVTLPSGLATVSTPVSLDLANGGETETVVVRNISTTKTASYAVSAANVNGSSDVDHITCSDDLACMVHGNGGNDIITGGALGDALYGDSGNDTVLGMAGNDVISGGAGKDTLTGGTGNDLIDAQDGEADTAIDCGGEDSDLLIFDSALDGTGLVGYSADTAGCIGH